MKVIECYHCGSEKLVKNEKSPQGKQRYNFRDCGKSSRENPDIGYSEERKEEILKAYQERSSMLSISGTFGVSRNTLAKWIQKS